MRITTEWDEFAGEVKMIWDSFRLRDLGIICSTNFVGTIIPAEIDDVIHFCEQNRAFHIVSFCHSGFVWNRYCADGDSFMLAEGNPDPNFVLDLREARFQALDDLSSLREVISPKPWK